MNTIRLTNYNTIQKEFIMAEDAMPGHLVERDTNGKLQKHNGSASVAQPMFLFEDELQGKDIDQAVLADNPGQAIIAGRGDEAQAVLADGENVSVGDKLESNGDGTLKQGTTAPIAIALEAMDLSASSGEEESGALGYDKRIQVEVL